MCLRALLHNGLSESERASGQLNEVAELFPIYQQLDARAEAPISVSALAFLLYRFLERKLNVAGLGFSPAQALQALRTARLLHFQLGDGRLERSVTLASARASQILAAEINELDPLTPRREAGVPKK